MFTFSSDIEFVPSVSNKILGSAPKQTNKQKYRVIQLKKIAPKIYISDHPMLVKQKCV